MSVTQTTIRMKCGRAAPHVLWTVATCLPLALSTQLAMARTASRPVHGVDPYIIAQAPAPESRSTGNPGVTTCPCVTACSRRAARGCNTARCNTSRGNPDCRGPRPAAASAKPDSTQKSDKTTASSAASESEGIPAVVIDGQQVEHPRQEGAQQQRRGHGADHRCHRRQIRTDPGRHHRLRRLSWSRHATDCGRLAHDRFPSDQKSGSLAVDLTRDQLRVAPVCKAGEQIVVLGRPRAEPAATAPRPPQRLPGCHEGDYPRVHCEGSKSSTESDANCRSGPSSSASGKGPGHSTVMISQWRRHG